MPFRLSMAAALLTVASTALAAPPTTFPLDEHTKKVFSQFGEDGIISSWSSTSTP